MSSVARVNVPWHVWFGLVINEQVYQRLDSKVRRGGGRGEGGKKYYHHYIPTYRHILATTYLQYTFINRQMESQPFWTGCEKNIMCT